MVFAVFIKMIFIVESHPKSDKIITLPGQPDHVSFQQFSGYITVNEKQHRALFYYFVEAEAQPDSRPLVLWLNGGICIYIYLYTIYISSSDYLDDDLQFDAVKNNVILHYNRLISETCFCFLFSQKQK